MNHRERVLTALRHEEPDRVPIDLGGTNVSTIMTQAYLELRQELGLDGGQTRVADVLQQVVIVEKDVCQALGVDMLPVFKEPREWRKDSLAGGQPVLYPAKFQPHLQPDGSQIVIDRAGNVVLKSPPNGIYFDPVYSPLADITSADDLGAYTAYIENYDRSFHLDKSYEEMAKHAKSLRENTDYVLVGQFGGHLFEAARALRGWETFLIDLLRNPKLAHALMDQITEANRRHFEHYARTVGPYLDVVVFNDDLGMQDRTLISPKLYRTMIKPYQKRLFGFVKSKCDAYLLLHTDGAVAPLIPDFIEMGIDAINPVQVSAAGMGSKTLKREFGRDIVFWGGGCDTQTILPLGTPDEVKDEVKRRIDDLAPGGGFVFCTVHNIQDKVPPANVVMAYETARAHGLY